MIHRLFMENINFEVEEFPEVEDVPQFGMVDNPQQFMELFGDKLKEGGRKFFVDFTIVSKSDQPEKDGFRYHKWGEYYGEQNLTTEYLYDEEEVDLIVLFHVYEILELA